MPSPIDIASNGFSPFSTPSPTSSTSSTSTINVFLAQDDPDLMQSMAQMASHRMIFGHNVIQVPCKQSASTDYVNLVLSQQEFDLMAVHLPQYEEMAPEELLERITQLLKDQEIKKRHCLGSCSCVTSNEQAATAGVVSDTLLAYQSRLLELEYEQKRIQTKLRSSKALQISLAKENTALRVQMEQIQQQEIDMDKVVQENELLKYQTLYLGGDVAKWKRVAITTLRELNTLKQELQMLQQQVKDDYDEMVMTVKNTMAVLVEDINEREQVLQQNYLMEKKEREAMAEKYYEVSGRIRVFCRLRPRKESEEEMKKRPALLMPRPNSLLVSNSGKEFAFDQVFGPQSTQLEVYMQIEPLIVSFTDGYNACIMAYGQTGSGKTHTMMGNRHDSLEDSADQLMLDTNAGVIPRALHHVFAMIKKRQMTYMDVLRVSMVEIYNDQILDLLHENSSRDGKNTVAKNEADFTARDVSDYGQVGKVMRDGNGNRNIAATKMNLESSRSHALVFLHLDSQHRETQEVRRSTLCLVDLAGSERISRSQVKGDRLRETQHINKSLAALGDVVYALQHKAKHTPYRNSKLTYLLRDMISGQAKTLLMLQLSPDTADVEETNCSLQFGARVSQVQMGAVRPSVESGAFLKLQEENRLLQAKTLMLETQLNDVQQQCLQQGQELYKAASSTEALEKQLRLLGEAQRGVTVANGLDRYDIPPEDRSLSRPPSPASSAKTSRSVTSMTLGPSTQSIRLARSIQSSASLPRQAYSRQSSQVSLSPRLSRPSRASSSAASSPVVSRYRCPESTNDRTERRMSLSAAFSDRVVDPDLRRESLSPASAGATAEYDNRRKSLSTLQTRSMSGLATPRSVQAKDALPSDGRVPLHPSSRTRSARSATASSSTAQNTIAGRVSKPRSAQAVKSSTFQTCVSPSPSVSLTTSQLTQTLRRASLTSSRTPSSTSPRTPTRAAAEILTTSDHTHHSSLTRSTPSSTRDNSARKSRSSSHSSGQKVSK